MWEGEGFSLLFVNFGFISLAVKLKTRVHVMCVPVSLCLLALV